MSAASSSWQWPSCKQPRTLSFRQQHHGHHTMMIKQAYKTMNSAYFPDSADSCFSNSFASVESLSTASEASGTVDANEAEAEAVMRALRSDRLLFEPDASPATTSSSILKKKAKVKVKAVNDDCDNKDTTTCIDGSSSGDSKQAAFDGATAMSVESENPYRDFRASMEEMVMSHGAKDWRWLEEMLGWYLRANSKSTHGLIVGAFVDLLVALSTSASPSSPTTATNCSSSSASACSLFSGIAVDEIKEEEEEAAA